MEICILCNYGLFLSSTIATHDTVNKTATSDLLGLVISQYYCISFISLLCSVAFLMLQCFLELRKLTMFVKRSLHFN